MVGKNIIKIDDSSFIQGMTSSDFSDDGGYSNASSYLNPFITPGIMYSIPALSGYSTGLTGNIIASCEDPYLGNNRYFLDDMGYYYTFNGSALTQKVQDNVNTYTSGFGTVDFIPYNGNFYNTTNNGAGTSDDIVQYNGNVTVDKTWWSSTKSKTKLTGANRHPQVVFLSRLYTGNKNKLVLWDEPNSLAVDALFTLDSGDSITAMAVHPNANRMIIAVSKGQNYSNTISTSSYIGVYDGYSTQFDQKIYVDEQINGFYPVGGTVFVTYGQNLGYFTGSGIKFLRKLKNVTLTGSSLDYKHHITNIGNILFVADGTQILAYGEIIQGQPSFHYIYTAASQIGLLANLGSNVLGVARSSASLGGLDLSSIASSSGGTFFSKTYDFNRPILLRGPRLIFANDVTTGITVGNFYYINEDGTTSTAIPVTNNNSASVRFIELPQINDKVQQVQFKYSPSSTYNIGLVSIEVPYDIAE